MYLGFLCFVEGDKEGALASYKRILECDPETRRLDTSGEWNDYSRLKWGAEHGYLYAFPQELKALPGERQRLATLLVDFHYITQHWDEARETVAVSDGAEWIQHQLRTRLPMIRVRILDYFHLMEHVGAAAVTCFGEGAPGAARWREAAAQAVNEEGGSGLLAQTVQTRRPCGPRPRGRRSGSWSSTWSSGWRCWTTRRSGRRGSTSAAGRRNPIARC